MKIYYKLAIWTLLICSANFVEASSSQDLKGNWVGPCSDGAAEKIGLSPPYIRIISKMYFTETRAGWEMRFFRDETCTEPGFAQTYEGNYTVLGDGVSGVDDQVWLEPLASEETDQLNQPLYCSSASWKITDRRDVTICHKDDWFLGSPYSYKFKFSVNGTLEIGGRLSLKKAESIARPR